MVRKSLASRVFWVEAFVDPEHVAIQAHDGSHAMAAHQELAKVLGRVSGFQVPLRPVPKCINALS